MPDALKLERELAYYRRECNDLGARLLRLQEEQSQAFREARRSRTVVKLIREAHRLADVAGSPDEMGLPLLEVIAGQHPVRPRALVLRIPSPDGAELFRVTHVLGFGAEPPEDPVRVPAPPAFFFTTSRTPLESPAYELTGILGVPFILWSYDAATGRGLIVGNRSEANVSRPFEAGDQELMEAALSVYLDILLRKRGEAELKRATAMAEEASALRARFIATLSHELRTPLNTIIGFSEMITEPARFRVTPEKGESYARHIHAAGSNLLALINDILDYSSLAQMAPSLALEWCPAAELIGNTVEGLSSLAIQKGVALVAGAVDPGLELRADRLRLGQILGNLISNGVKFTPAGGRVTVSLRREPDGSAALEVADTGVGMRAEDIPRALEPFRQLDAGHARAFPGSGLGLPIASGFAAAHGGRLRIESEPGVGTRATLLLPADALRDAPGDAPFPATRLAAGQAPPG
jgi:signal transduction histidine kinase